MENLSARAVYLVTAGVVLWAFVLDELGLDRLGGLGEHSFATYYSIALLVGISLIAFHTARHRAEDTDGSKRHAPLFWRLVGLAFLYLALDEGLQIHENLDRWFHRAFSVSETAWTDRIDDLILLFYGCVGMAMIYVFRTEMLGSAKVRRYLVNAFLLFLITVLLDVLTNRSEYLDWMGLTGSVRQWVGVSTNALEEIIKLFVGATLLLAFSEASRALGRNTAQSDEATAQT